MITGSSNYARETLTVSHSLTDSVVLFRGLQKTVEAIDGTIRIGPTCGGKMSGFTSSKKAEEIRDLKTVHRRQFILKICFSLPEIFISCAISSSKFQHSDFLEMFSYQTMVLLKILDPDPYFLQPVQSFARLNLK